MVVLGCGCVDVDTDAGEHQLPPVDGPTALLDPSAGVIPFPNNLVLDPGTGLVNLPAPCDELPAQQLIREQLNTLDGFGTFHPSLQTTFTAALDASSLAGRVMMFERLRDGVAVPAEDAVPLPIATRLVDVVQPRADCDGSISRHSLIIVPLVPLAQRSTYVVVLRQGIMTSSGKAVLPSPTWALIRQQQDPVVVSNGEIVTERTPLDPVADRDQLLGLDLLWKAHAPALAFVDTATGLSRSQILLAWELRTQTTIDPLDPTVSGSVAQKLAPDRPAGIASITGSQTAPEFLRARLGDQACALVNCDAVGNIVAGAFETPDYQQAMPNPMPQGLPIPGAWSDPLAPALVREQAVSLIAFVPATPAPPDGYPVIVFGHDLSRSRNDLFAVGPQLAAAGFVSVAIDWVAHGSRAVRISDDATLGCDGTPAPTTAPQCFAPVLSTDLAVTRDNLRQSVLDLLSLLRALDDCADHECGVLDVDPSRMGFWGHGLGAFIGAIAAATEPRFRASVFSAGGVGLVDWVELTDTLALRCTVVDALISAGVLAGQLSDLTATPPTGTCVGDAWRNTPAWLSFATAARWLLDPADGANFVGRQAARPLLLQQVVGDTVMPSRVAEQHAGLLGIASADADPSGSPDTVSSAITTAPHAQKWLRYASLPAYPTSGFPGNEFGHASPLAPVSTDVAAILATALMQQDAITYLFNNVTTPGGD